MTHHSGSKVSLDDAPRGKDGDYLLAGGSAVALRMWKDEAAGEPKATAARPYETVGYVISGSAELHLEDSVEHLHAGDSWVVPAGTNHTYKILSAFTAVEATSPPAGRGGEKTGEATVAEKADDTEGGGSNATPVGAQN